MKLNIAALVREAYEIVKAQIEAEEGSTMETAPRGSKDVEEDSSLRTEDGAYVEAEGVYNGDMGEGAEQVILSSCGKRTATEKVGNYEATNTTSRVGKSFGMHSTRRSQA